MRAILLLTLFLCGCFAQTVPTFAVASVKKSARIAGRDARGAIVAGPDRLSAHNVSLKDLLVEAHHLEPFQISGPSWLDSDEFDIEAKSDSPVDRAQLRAMLRTLLSERFQLKTHTESKEIRAHALIADQGGPKIHPAKEGAPAAPAPGLRNFHGELREFANLLSVQLSIPPIADPGRPSMASGPPVPVIDQTGLPGVYDFSFVFKPEPDVDMFQLWQRILQDQLGLRLEARKTKADFLVVDAALRAPRAN